MDDNELEIFYTLLAVKAVKCKNSDLIDFILRLLLKANKQSGITTDAVLLDFIWRLLEADEKSHAS